MLFNSLSFALFLGVVYAIFLLTPARWKIWWLLAASYVFYGFSSLRACVVLLCVSLICFWGGRWIEAAEEYPRRQLTRLFVLIGSVGAVLIYFKFVPLIAAELKQFGASVRGGRPDFLLFFVPIGYSYYIFQGVGYLIDIYWGKPGAKHMGNFLLFMAFFPKVMMGPIERGHRLLPQIEQIGSFRFDYDRFREGLLLFGWGLFKKLVVAEHLALLVNPVYSNPRDMPGLPVAAAILAFIFQLYSDFSGYTDMALGVGKLFGIELTQNFNRPFTATDIQDFWRRWHITLSLWIGDYVYLPLRMSLRSMGKTGLAIALMVTFFLIGVWHGTGWTFAIFGLVQGFYMVGSALTLPARNSFWERQNQLDKLWLVTCRRVVTFCMFALSLVFFRATTVRQAFTILASLVGPADWRSGWNNLLQFSPMRLVVIVLFMELIESFIRSGQSPFARLVVRPWWQRWPAYIGLMLAILCGGVFTSAQRFIYFAF